MHKQIELKKDNTGIAKKVWGMVSRFVLKLQKIIGIPHSVKAHKVNFTKSYGHGILWAKTKTKFQIFIFVYLEPRVFLRPTACY